MGRRRRRNRVGGVMGVYARGIVFLSWWGPNVSTAVGISDRLTLWGQLQKVSFMKRGTMFPFA